ncbi:MAG: phenylalanine--tRNA ligase subunit beta [Deltaproteobacteria bacterium]
MKLTVNWLKQFAKCDLTPSVIADRLTMLGLEVDAVEELFPHLDQVVAARITEVRPHPDADRLVVCVAQTGNESVDIVCGAPNAREGMLTALALPGVELPGGLTIKKSKIRGQQSNGMFCSEKDLGLSEDHSGIIELGENFTLGAPLRQALGLDDTMIEIDLTPNRPDCTSVYGVAREIAGVSGCALVPPALGQLPKMTGQGLPFEVEVKEPEACPRYAARLLKNVTIAPSPPWLASRLRAVGLRPINNVVDITNYVMLEMGQPLHAFDFDLLAGSKIIVRFPRPGETMTTLDGAERDLEADMLMICDGEKPVAVAGVMGGGNSEVRPTTRNILLESACFDPKSIRRTSRRLTLNTDASYRFERGVDPQLAPWAMARAVRMMEEITGASAVDGGYDCLGQLKENPAIILRRQRTVDLLGAPYTCDQLAALLTSIEIGVEKIDEETLRVVPPSFRVDLEREIDLIEEVARLTGYNDLPSVLPQVPMAFPEVDKERQLHKAAAHAMIGQGFYEAINYSFVNEDYFDQLQLTADDPHRQVVRLLNPIAENQAIMRTMLLPGLLENVCHNINRQQTAVRLFEIGKVFQPAGEAQPREAFSLCAVLSGARYPGAAELHFGTAQVDFYDVKGAVEQLLDQLRLDSVQFTEAGIMPYAEQEEALGLMTADGQLVGMLGRIGTKVLKNFGIRQDVFFFEITLESFASHQAALPGFTPLPRFMAMKWDMAIITADEVRGKDIVDHIMAMAEPLVEAVEIFDVYSGKPIEPGLKSIGIAVQYRSADQTLDDQTVGVVHQRIIQSVLTKFKGRLREE